MAKTQTSERRALEAAESRNSGHTGFAVVSDVAFFDGRLFTIKSELGTIAFENFVVVRGSAEPEVLRNAAALAHYVSLQSRDKPAVDRIAQIGGAPGVIALVITLTICGLFLFRPDSRSPEVLSNALTMVLGFYFGTRSTKALPDGGGTK